MLGIDLVEISLLDGMDHLLHRLKTLDLRRVRFVFSYVGMGFNISIHRDGRDFNLWQELGIPFITLHGDSPAYFFDRHVVHSNNFISLYIFSEHCVLRRRLPEINGPIATLPPIVLDEISIEEIDFRAKRDGTLLFLKNGKDPVSLRRLWASCMEPRMLQMILEIADELESHLDSTDGNQIDDVVTRYFDELGVDTQGLIKLRLFFIAQLDDYLRAVKCTRMALALMDFPVQIRGNNWSHLDFSGKKATYIDDCNYVDSVGLIRDSLGLIDMSPNTGSLPHDRVMRAYGSKTLCLTNENQDFLGDLPHCERLVFGFEKGSLQSRIADLLAHKSDAVDLGVAVAEAFRKLHPPERSLGKLLDYAALARLDQMPQRPVGVQDFFVWPPQLLRGGMLGA
jgi:hypothetical protein